MTGMFQIDLPHARMESTESAGQELYKTLGSLKKQILRRKPGERGVKMSKRLQSWSTQL